MFLGEYISEMTSMADTIFITTMMKVHCILTCKLGTVSLLGKVEQKD